MTPCLPSILPGAEPYFYRGGPIGCLCLHGFMASPNELEWLGKSLAARDFTVYVPRLTGHGIDHRHMSRMRWGDWYTSALDGYLLLRQQCELVIPIGLSMGGLLALMLASKFPVAGVGVLAAPLFIRARIVRHTRWLKYFVRYTNQPDTEALRRLIRETQIQRGEAVVGRVRYDTWATSAVWEFYKLMTCARTRLPQVSAPLLLIYAAQDTTAPPENIDLIGKESRSHHIEQHVLSQTGHILSQDVERETVFQLVGDFAARQGNFHKKSM